MDESSGETKKCSTSSNGPENQKACKPSDFELPSDLHSYENKIKLLKRRVSEASSRSSGPVSPAGGMNVPFFIGLGLGLGLNIVGYFAFKAYFRSFLEAVPFRPSGAPFGINRSDFEGLRRYRQKRLQQHQLYYKSQPSGGDRQENKYSKRRSQSPPERDREESDRVVAIKQHLRTLNLPLSSLSPSAADIKRAYRVISLKTHPDVVSSKETSVHASTNQNQFLKDLQSKRFMHATAAHDELLRMLHGK